MGLIDMSTQRCEGSDWGASFGDKWDDKRSKPRLVKAVISARIRLKIKPVLDLIREGRCILSWPLSMPKTIGLLAGASEITFKNCKC